MSAETLKLSWDNINGVVSSNIYRQQVSKRVYLEKTDAYTVEKLRVEIDSLFDDYLTQRYLP